MAKAKRLSEYTDAELMNLSTKEIEEIALVEAVHEGVPAPLEFPGATFENPLPTNVTAYKIPELYLGNQDDVDRVIKLLNTLNVYTSTYGLGWKFRYLVKAEEINFNPEGFYSEAFYEKNQVKLEHIKNQMENYNDTKRKYEESVRNMRPFREAVTKDIKAAMDRDSAKRNVKYLYSTYMRILDNEEQVYKVVATQLLMKEEEVRVICSEEDSADTPKS